MHVSLHAKDASPPLPIVYDSSFRFQNRSLDTPPEDDRSMTATVSAVVETWTHAVLPFIFIISQRCRTCTVRVQDVYVYCSCTHTKIDILLTTYESTFEGIEYLRRFRISNLLPEDSEYFRKYTYVYSTHLFP